MTISKEEFAQIDVGSILNTIGGTEVTVIGRLNQMVAVTYKGCSGPRVNDKTNNTKWQTYREKWSIPSSVDGDVRLVGNTINYIESIASFCLHTPSLLNTSSPSQINESAYEERKRAASRYCGTADGETPEAQTRNGGMRFL